jgi:hypothetical protein
MHLKTLGLVEHNESNWEVALHDEFVPEFWQLPKHARVGITGLMVNLREKGPLLGRPQADTLNGSRYANMKELRFKVDGGVWRVAFAFDPTRKAILLVAGDKSGVGQRQFYRNLIRIADARFERYLETIHVK